MPAKQPSEILTIANHILGTGQLSLAKFLFITADDTNQLHIHHVQAYMEYVLERIDLSRDIHFYTNTTIDTLDYSGYGPEQWQQSGVGCLWRSKAATLHRSA